MAAMTHSRCKSGVVIGAWLALLSGCTESAVGATAELTGQATDAGNTDAATLAQDATSIVEQNSCVGTALQAGYAAFDSQCAFLDQCVHAGNCFCGNGCAANKVKCDAAYCPKTPPTCGCGKACGDLVQCPKYICGDTLPDTCETHDDCVYNSEPPPAWCGCQPMADHCFCGDSCLPNVQKCNASTCAKFPAKGCTANTESYKNCYCQKCGLHGTTPKCFYLLCPG